MVRKINSLSSLGLNIIMGDSKKQWAFQQVSPLEAKVLVIALRGFYPMVKTEQVLCDVLVGGRYPCTNGGNGTAGI